MHQIVVAGAGPVGLWAACELQRMGVSVLVLESLVERPQAGAKASTIHPRTMEMLRMRGLDTQVLENSVRIPRAARTPSRC
jgi:2-polyprenyl-6-methoxyphenol hydroxylase-like FAD-dependent oxidoreductase